MTVTEVESAGVGIGKRRRPCYWGWGFGGSSGFRTTLVFEEISSAKKKLAFEHKAI
jgi:hypothetical protein